MIMLITYNERMEKPVRLRKIGPVACKSIPNVESIADFNSHREDSESGMELSGLGRPATLSSSNPPIPCVHCLEEQASPIEI
jgi:hypothetical protein